MTTTVFITHCWKSAARAQARAERGRAWPALWRWLAATLLVLAAGWAPPARADVPTEITQLRVERNDEAVYLSSNLKFELPSVVEDALLKGLAMVFVAEADIYRDRWYWYDKRVTSAARHMRLSYQPLTRRWRLQVAPGLIGNTGLGVTLAQHFDTLGEAVAVIQRISRWKIAEATELEADARYSVEFRFRLDVSQLPRPFQIGAVGQPEWRISATRNQRLVVEVAQ